jgi:hypothetical protein
MTQQPQKLEYLLRFSVSGTRDVTAGREEKYTALRNLLACATSEADGLKCGMPQDVWAELAHLDSAGQTQRSIG